MKTWFLVSAIAGFGTLTVGLAAAGSQPRSGHDQVGIGHVERMDRSAKGMLPVHHPERIHADHAINNHEGVNEKRAIDEPENRSQLAPHQPGFGRAANSEKDPPAPKADHPHTFGASSPRGVDTAAKLTGIPNKRTNITAASIGGPTIAVSKGAAAILNGTAMKRRQ